MDRTRRFASRHFSAHGEFPWIVLGVSDPESCFTGIQHALNLAEVYHVPVLVLSEKRFAKPVRTIEPFPQKPFLLSED